MNRVSTGIKDIDAMIEGGIPEGAIVGLQGPPGVGKSIFSLHFALSSAKSNSRCLYLNLDEPLKNIERSISSLNLKKEFEKHQKDKKIDIKCYNYLEFEQISSDFFDRIEESEDIDFMIIDSFNCFLNYIKAIESTEKHGKFNAQNLMNKAFDILRKKNITTLLVLEKSDNTKTDFVHHIPYLVDGIIQLDFLDFGSIERRIFIPKMRWTNQFKDSKSYKISKKGIEIEPEEEWKD